MIYLQLKTEKRRCKVQYVKTIKKYQVNSHNIIIYIYISLKTL